MEVQNLLAEKKPGLVVVGEEYPVAFIRRMTSTLLTIAQYFTLACLFFGQKIWSFLNMPEPKFFIPMREKSWQYLIGIMIGGNLLNNALMSTGAFEMILNDQLIFSKLALNRLPTIPEILSLING